MSTQKKGSDSKAMVSKNYEQFKKQLEKTFSTSYKKSGHPTDYLAQYQLHQAENDIVHSPYSMEQQMLAAITEGNKKEFQKVTQSFSSYSVGQLSDTIAKSLEYSAVTFLALVSRAAIAGGVDPMRGYDLSDLFLQQIAKCTSADEYFFLIEYIEETYMNEVIRAKDSLKEPIPLKKAKAYIAKKLSQKLVLDEIAEESCVDKSYLMRLFKKHTGMTITEYIGRARIHAAAEMLTYSNFTIGQIAMFFQFSTQSRFGYLFKKYMHMTPSEYRRTACKE